MSDSGDSMEPDGGPERQEPRLIHESSSPVQADTSTIQHDNSVPEDAEDIGTQLMQAAARLDIEPESSTRAQAETAARNEGVSQYHNIMLARRKLEERLGALRDQKKYLEEQESLYSPDSPTSSQHTMVGEPCTTPTNRTNQPDPMDLSMSSRTSHTSPSEGGTEGKEGGATPNGDSYKPNPKLQLHLQLVETLPVPNLIQTDPTSETGSIFIYTHEELSSLCTLYFYTSYNVHQISLLLSSLHPAPTNTSSNTNSNTATKFQPKDIVARINFINGDVSAPPWQHERWLQRWVFEENYQRPERFEGLRQQVYEGIRKSGGLRKGELIKRDLEKELERRQGFWYGKYVV